MTYRTTSPPSLTFPSSRRYSETLFTGTRLTSRITSPSPSPFSNASATLDTRVTRTPLVSSGRSSLSRTSGLTSSTEILDKLDLPDDTKGVLGEIELVQDLRAHVVHGDPELLLVRL